MIHATLTELLERIVENLIYAPVNLQELSIFNSDLMRKLVLCESYAKKGSQALEKITIAYSFGLVGSIPAAWNHLRHLINLHSITYINNTRPTIADQMRFPIGFAHLTKLSISADFPIGSNFVKLFPAVVDLHLNHLGREALRISSHSGIQYEATAELHPLHPVLPRFENLTSFTIEDRRPITADLIGAITSFTELTELKIGRQCGISFDLSNSILSNLEGRRAEYLEKFKLIIDLHMEIGTLGISYKNGATPILENDILVPAVGWKKAVWESISYQQGRELVRHAEEIGVNLLGSIPDAIKVEEAFEEELPHLERVLKFMRGEITEVTSPVKNTLVKDWRSIE